MLLNYYPQRQFTEEEIMQAIREIAAYIGKVIVTRSTGKWHIHDVGGLWGTEIVFDGPVKTIKGRQAVTYNKSVVNLGQIASGTWSALQLGIEPKLYKVYRVAISKAKKEDLR